MERNGQAKSIAEGRGPWSANEKMQCSVEDDEQCPKFVQFASQREEVVYCPKRFMTWTIIIPLFIRPFILFITDTST